MLYGFGIKEIEAVLGHAALEGTLEDVRLSLGIPDGQDLALLADLLEKKAHAQNVTRDIKAQLFQDGQACHIIQLKSLEYMKSYRGNATLHESSVKRLEVTDRGLARTTALVTKEKKAQEAKQNNVGAGGGGGSGGKAQGKTGGQGKKPYDRRQQGQGGGAARDKPSTYNGTDPCFHCKLPSHLGYPCPPLPKP
jgi:hypothetical protein